MLHTLSSAIKNWPKQAIIGTVLASSLIPATMIPAANAQGRFDKTQITTQEVAPGIYMLQGAGGNIGLSTGDDGPFIIDDQFAPLSEKILAAIASVTPDAPKFVLNTHWHGDHTGGNENLHQAGATIVAHDNVRKRLLSGRDGAQDFKPAASGALPVITFSDQLTFHWNDHEIFVHHPDPAHTDGDAIVFFKDSNVVHMGDVYFKGNYPYIDIGSGGSLNGYINAHSDVLELIDDDTVLIPGHGNLAKKADLIETRDMLVEVRTKIQKAIDDGLSEDETVERNPLKKLSKKWGQGFIKNEPMTRTAYKSLTK